MNGSVYASDMDGAPARSLAIMRGASVAVLDGTFWWKKKVIPGHFSVDETIRFAKKLRPRGLYLTQIGHNFPPHDEAENFIGKIDAPFPVHAAYDGLTIRV